MAGELGHVAHRDAQIGIGEPGRVGEGRVLQPDLARPLGQHFAESGFVAGERFGDRDAGVVGGIDDDALDQIRHRDPAVNGGKHGRAVRRRAALAPGVFADDELVVELDAALLDLVEQIFQRHQLGETCRLDRQIGVLVEQHAVAVEIDQNRGGNAGLEALPFFGGRGSRRTCGDDCGGDADCGDERGRRRRQTAEPPPPNTARHALRNSPSNATNAIFRQNSRTK